MKQKNSKIFKVVIPAEVIDSEASIAQTRRAGIHHHKEKNSNMSTNFLQKIYHHKFQIAILLVLILASFLRFYNFQNRWGIGDDDTRDIAIAREAIARHELPLIGSFSSAGPFVFGPIFYWIIMISYLILPFVFTAPVIITILAGIATVGILAACGYLIGGKRLSILIGILVATSPQLTIRSVVLGQHTYVAITTALLFLTYILYWQKKKLLYAFLMGISLGAALSFHYQSINLLIFFAAVLLVPAEDIVIPAAPPRGSARRESGIQLHQNTKNKLINIITVNWLKRLSGLGLMLVGFLIPSTPLIIWDSQQQWANVRNILDYLFIGQYRLYVPNSWKLFIFKYLPSYWSFVVSGYLPIALFLMCFICLITVYVIIKKKLSGIMLAFGIIFSILLLVNRFYKGERSEGYLIYLSPFVILFTAWSIDKLLEMRGKRPYTILAQIAGYAILLTILIGNTFQALNYEKGLNSQAILNKSVSFLVHKYPNTKFNIYDFHNRSGDMSQPLSLFLKMKNKTDPHGMPIGLVCWSAECPQNLPKITTLGYNSIVSMQQVSNRDIKSSGWVKVNQESMYDDLIGWSKKHELKSTFSLWNFIVAKFEKKL